MDNSPSRPLVTFVAVWGRASAIKGLGEVCARWSLERDESRDRLNGDFGGEALSSFQR